MNTFRAKGLTLSILIVLIIVRGKSYAMAIKPRLREHFDHHTISTAGQEFSYSGLSNTINLWYEKPFEYAIGLAINPVLGNTKYKDGLQSVLGEKITLRLIGIEAKHFPVKLIEHGFYRVGLFYTELQTDTAFGDLSGWSFLIGVGHEFKIWKMGIAPEFAIRRSFLANSTSVLSITPSIGFHFYVM
jgi:hypothetical protein